MKRETDEMGHIKCKYCKSVAMCDDDLARCESSHGGDLEDFELVDGNFKLKDENES